MSAKVIELTRPQDRAPLDCDGLTRVLHAALMKGQLEARLRRIAAKVAEGCIAERVARSVIAASKALHVYDFDDTLVTSTGSISVQHVDGKKDTLDSVLFAHYNAQPGESLDFSDFNDVNRPRKIKKNFDKLREHASNPDNRVVILTARPHGSATAVGKYLASQGITNASVVALQSSNPKDKADWISKEIDSGGYNEVSFTDDSSRNVAAVASIAERHPKTKLETFNPSHPKEEDYDGGHLDRRFKSDKPTKAISHIPHSKTDIPEAPKSSPGTEEWWNSQTPEFKRRYLQQHPHSRLHM